MKRTLDGFWWTYREGDDWPSWYFGEKVAREALNRLVRGSPGRKVSTGTLAVDGTFILSDRIEAVSE
jgi:hypothetical protein